MILNPQNIVYSKLKRLDDDNRRIELRHRIEDGKKITLVQLQTPKLAFWDLTDEYIELAFIHDEHNEQALGLFRTLLIELDDKFRHDKCLSKLNKTYKYQSLLYRKQRGLFPVTTLRLNINDNVGIFDENKKEMNDTAFKSLAKKGTRFIALFHLKCLDFSKKEGTFKAVLNLLQLQVFAESHTLMSYAFKDIEVIEDVEEEFILDDQDSDKEEEKPVKEL